MKLLGQMLLMIVGIPAFLALLVYITYAIMGAFGLVGVWPW